MTPTLTHAVARRRTADDKTVCLWDDGSLTWALGMAIRGSAHPRTPEQTARALRAGWLVLGEVEMFDADEVSSLIAAARWAADRDGLPGTLRARLVAQSAPMGSRPVWTVTATDADGNATAREWHLPRMSPWAGLVVSHERGRFEILRAVQRSGLGVRSEKVLVPTGFVRSSLRETIALLPVLAAKEIS
jgi:hypothetical protein